MQKKLIVLALAGMVAAPAFAQSNVTVYGRVDYGYMSRGGDDGLVSSHGRKGEMASGIQSGSRLGFKGAEDLGNGLKAIFEIESGVSNDAASTQSAGLWATNRHAYVGLTGNFGTAVGGRLDGVRYGLFNKYDAFAGGGLGNFTQMTAQVDRADNAVAYISPKWNGFGFVAAYATDVAGQEQTGTALIEANTGDGVLKTIMGTYDNGPLSVSLDYERIDFENMGSDRTYVATAGASYDFGMVKVSGVYDIIKNRTNDVTAYNVRNWFVSAKVPYGKFDFKATYGRVKDKEVDDADAGKFGIGVNYNLSKRTNVYLDYGRISNDSGAGYALNPAANAGGAGYGVSGVALGLAHNF